MPLSTRWSKVALEFGKMSVLLHQQSCFIYKKISTNLRFLPTQYFGAMYGFGCNIYQIAHPPMLVLNYKVFPLSMSEKENRSNSVGKIATSLCFRPSWALLIDLRLRLSAFCSFPLAPHIGDYWSGHCWKGRSATIVDICKLFRHIIGTFHHILANYSQSVAIMLTFII